MGEIRREAGSIADHPSGVFAEIHAGHRFSATLSLETPLRVLEWNGRFVARGEPLPDYRDNPAADQYGRYGHWIPLAASPDELGLDVSDELRAYLSGRGSEAHEAAAVEFLKAFRRIVEDGTLTTKRQVEAINRLPLERAEWGDFATNHIRCEASKSGGAHDLAATWFRWQLDETVAGVGPKLAASLYDAGFRSAGDIAAATDEALLEVPGLGRGTLAKMRNR